MKKFERLGKLLTKEETKKITGGTCYATCQNGVTCGLDCPSGSSCFASQDTIGAIACGGRLYAYGCPATIMM